MGDVLNPIEFRLNEVSLPQLGDLVEANWEVCTYAIVCKYMPQIELVVPGPLGGAATAGLASLLTAWALIPLFLE